MLSSQHHRVLQPRISVEAGNEGAKSDGRRRNADREPINKELSFGFRFVHAKHVELKQLNKFQPARKDVQAMLITLDLDERS